MTKSMPSDRPASTSAISSKLVYERCKNQACAEEAARCGSDDIAPATTSACPSSSEAMRCTAPMNEPWPPPPIPPHSLLFCMFCFMLQPQNAIVSLLILRAAREVVEGVRRGVDQHTTNEGRALPRSLYRI